MVSETILPTISSLFSAYPAGPKLSFFDEQDEETYKLLIIPTLATFLEVLVELNEEARNPRQNASFEAKVAPEISIQEYLQRIVKYTPCSKECFLISLIYMDRMVQTSQFVINSLSVHRVLITSLLLSAKLFDDITYNNRYYSHVGGIPLQELNALETQFLRLIGHNLHVEPEMFHFYREAVEMASLNAFPTQALPAAVSNTVLNREARAINIPTSRNRGRQEPMDRRKLRRSHSFSTTSLYTPDTEWLPRFFAKRRSFSSVNVEVFG